ncbi:BQ5605_C003g01880 [Microbotryum silenes-dioicae]|uniref:BQ5605_C003g01880 protein n=1 Tax=Microbotryum silenes-dioicae TaxID=796604 RepID=A0A2X0P2R1_9BASI|nr:BQ5605_C003g01880 [Microbotryum silenes-dioicae]
MIDHSCVSCASLNKNVSTCTRSIPLTCSYGVVNPSRRKNAFPAKILSFLICYSRTNFTGGKIDYTLYTVLGSTPACRRGKP